MSPVVVLVSDAKLQWYTNPTPDRFYACIAPYLYLHAEPATGHWWLTGSAMSTGCEGYAIAEGKALRQTREHMLVSIERQASNALMSLARAFAQPVRG
jgi:hypothetical protein